jgi:hypothetical protein
MFVMVLDMTLLGLHMTPGLQRAWLQQKQERPEEQELITWPQHLIQHMYIVGLAPDVEVTQIAMDLLGRYTTCSAAGQGLSLIVCTVLRGGQPHAIGPGGSPSTPAQ